MHFGSEASDRCAFVFGMYLLCKVRCSAGRRIRVVAIKERSRQVMGRGGEFQWRFQDGSPILPAQRQVRGPGPFLGSTVSTLVSAHHSIRIMSCARTRLPYTSGSGNKTTTRSSVICRSSSSAAGPSSSPVVVATEVCLRDLGCDFVLRSLGEEDMEKVEDMLSSVDFDVSVDDWREVGTALAICEKSTNALVGSVTTYTYPSKTGDEETMTWLGNLVVHPEYRSRGGKSTISRLCGWRKKETHTNNNPKQNQLSQPRVFCWT